MVSAGEETPNAGKEMVKVLVVDDDPSIRTILTDIFKKRGYFVMAVGSGADRVR